MTISSKMTAIKTNERINERAEARSSFWVLKVLRSELTTGEAYFIVCGLYRLQFDDAPISSPNNALASKFLMHGACRLPKVTKCALHLFRTMCSAQSSQALDTSLMTSTILDHIHAINATTLKHIHAVDRVAQVGSPLNAIFEELTIVYFRDTTKRIS